ncbi:MAG: RNA pyrophosphohydrolase [Bdellovibrionales bacterium]|nr:RNA pyrophosphohydrolase [Bdellovibrionales bacterium]
MKLGYRDNVAVLVLDQRGRLLVCERADVPGAWQLPQGGIEPGEEPLQALYRELAEEIGTADVEIIGKLPHPILYEWPQELYVRGYRGQRQHYFLVRLAPGAALNLNNGAAETEFCSYKWMSADEFLGCISSFKAEAYTTALRAFQQQFPGIIFDGHTARK